MKKLLLFSAFVLLSGLVCGQTFKPGVVVAVAQYEIILNQDITMKQFTDFYVNKYIPEADKAFPGVKHYLTTGDRGENKYSIGAISVFESVEVRDKYYPVAEATESSEPVKAAAAILKPVSDEINKMITYSKRNYTDWIIK